MTVRSEALASRVRQHCVHMTHRGRSSHVGSGLSVADILSVLYAEIMRVDPHDPDAADRDRLILSKGHAGAALYAVLAESGFFPIETLEQHCADGSVLSGHVSHKVPGVDFSTGSLGHGLGVAAGMALAAQQDRSDRRVFCVMSDGECDEGSVWEAALFASHWSLSSLTAIVDYNKIQSLDSVENTIRLEPFAAKWRAFGWNVRETDGHDHEELQKATLPVAESAPTIVIAHTTKGKGVSFMEDSVLWHYRTPQGDEYRDALQELGVPS